MESNPKLKRVDSLISEDFSFQTIPSNRNSMKSTIQHPKISKKRVCGIVINFVLGTAIIVDLFIWQLHYQHLENESKKLRNERINESLALSMAINEVRIEYENPYDIVNHIILTI